MITIISTDTFPFAALVPQVAGGSDTYATSWIMDKNDSKSQRYEIY